MSDVSYAKKIDCYQKLKIYVQGIAKHDTDLKVCRHYYSFSFV